MTVLFVSWEFYKYSGAITQVSQRSIQSKLTLAGLDAHYPIKIINSEQTYHPYMDDYFKMFCTEIVEFEPTGYAKHKWVKGLDDNTDHNAVRKSAAMMSDVGTCLTGTHPKNIGHVYSYIMDVSVSRKRGRYNGFEVMFYDPATKRLLFYGYKI